MLKTKREKAGALFTLIAMAVCGVLILCLVGCRTAQANKGNAAAASMQRAAIEVQAESNAVEVAMKALNELQNDQGGDLREPFRQYTKAVDRLASAAQKTEATGDRMAKENTAYLASWDKTLQTIDYQHIRELSQARKEEVAERFRAVNQQYQESEQAVQPLIAYFRDIRTALAADLTSGGMASLKEIVENAGRNAAKVQTALAALEKELNNSGTKLSSLVPQTEQTGAKE